jgi:hypothetical protein
MPESHGGRKAPRNGLSSTTGNSRIAPAERGAHVREGSIPPFVRGGEGHPSRPRERRHRVPFQIMDDQDPAKTRPHAAKRGAQLAQRLRRGERLFRVRPILGEPHMRLVGDAQESRPTMRLLVVVRGHVHRDGVQPALGTSSLRVIAGEALKGLEHHGLHDVVQVPPAHAELAQPQTFEETVRWTSGVHLWGGRDCTDGSWERRGNEPFTTIAPVPKGVPLTVISGLYAFGEATEKSISTVFGVRARAADASAPDGKSSIAMILNPGARVTLRSCEVIAGNGKDGEPGEDAPRMRASDGAPGNAGRPACTADVVAGGAPAVSACEGMNEPVGGAGGAGLVDRGGDGSDGTFAPEPNPTGSGLGGLGFASDRCEAGQPGRNGDAGAWGVGASGLGMLTLTGWQGVRGVDGQPGQGGGGGGGSRGGAGLCHPSGPQGGASGGSGGGGGCDGKGGRGGGWGGSSLAIVSVDAELDVEASELQAGFGGIGGIGGTGQPGGQKGLPGPGGASSPMEWACDGGLGGQGGDGGFGGGGLGGHSIAIASAGGKITYADLVQSIAQGGVGGRGGDPTFHQATGAAGQQGLAYELPVVEQAPPR